MDRRLVLPLSLISLFAAACSAPRPETGRDSPVAAAPSQPAQAPRPPSGVAQTSEAYRKDFAERVAKASPDLFHDPLPKMLKSIVVVDVTVDRDGKLTNAAIRRSNGYKDLEKVALASVHRAGPYGPPPNAMRRRDGSANFLETFLFRDDGRFKIRTLAEVQ